MSLLLASGYSVAEMTRSHENVRRLENIGEKPALCHVYNTESIKVSMVNFDPDIVISLLTDLPDDAKYLGGYSEKITG